MSADDFHSFRPAPGFGRRWPAGLKLGAALALILFVVLTPPGHWRWLLPVVLGVGGLLLASGIPWRFLVRRLLWLEPLVLGVAGLMLLQPDGASRCLLAVAKANLCLLTTLLLSQTTPPSEMLEVLRKLRVPWLFITTLALLQRYLFVLAEEAERMRRARASRTFARGRRFQWQALSSVVGQLFVRASERAERIYDAMCARGWK